MQSPDGQRMQRAAWVDYPPAVEASSGGAPVMLLVLMIVSTSAFITLLLRMVGHFWDFEVRV